MAIKTKEEMFGNDNGYGPSVPYSTTNPPGHSAGNRGVAFGENLTSAIANRTHYALCLNDEDLNTRLVPFETDGLDAAYRLGAAAVAGGGRVVVLDGAAVETQSALATLYSADPANAHFRANALGDTSGGSVGYDFVSLRAGGASYDAAAGFIDRRVFTSASGDTILNAVENVTLNPGGAGATLIELDTGGRQFHDGSSNSILKTGYDFIEILTGVHAGLYYFYSWGTAADQATVRALDGTSPAFGAGLSATASVYRAKFVSYGGWAARSRRGVVLVGHGDRSSSEFATLSLLAGATSVLNPEDGVATKALQFVYGTGTATGTTTSPIYFDTFGRLYSSIGADSLPAEDVLYRGAHTTRVVKGAATNDGEIAHIVEGSNAVDNRYDFLSMTYLDPTVTGYATTMAYTLNYNDSLDVAAAGLGAEWDNITPCLGSLVEILTPASDAGLYIAVSCSASTDRLYVLNLDGTAPGLTTGGGPGTFRVHTFCAMGRFLAWPAHDFDSTTDVTLSPSAIVSVRDDDDAVGLLIAAPDYDILTAERWALLTTTQTGAGNPYKVAGIRADGAIYGASYNYGDPPTSSIVLPTMQATCIPTEWNPTLLGGSSSDYWVSEAAENPSPLQWSFRLPTGATLTRVRVAVNPGAIRTGGDRITVVVKKVAHDDWTASAPARTVTNIGTYYDNGIDADPQVIDSTAISNLVANGLEEFIVTVTSGNSPQADIVNGVRIDFTDPGPRNS